MIDVINHVDSQSALRKACIENPKKCRKLLALELIRLLATTPLSQRLPWYINYISVAEPLTNQSVIPTPTPVVGWQSIFDNTHWEAYPGYGSWNASEQRWDHTGGYIYLSVIGTWADLYRPTHVRVEHSGGDLATFAVENLAEEYLTIEPDYVSLTEEELIYPTADPADDIFWLYIIGDFPTITEIEFWSLPI